MNHVLLSRDEILSHSEEIASKESRKEYSDEERKEKDNDNDDNDAYRDQVNA